ncbi:MAG: SatD family protein [Candidatus Azobacteroides sp.]|nr:SatD family protein [Candidatus Azobacteroides sp.]
MNKATISSDIVSSTSLNVEQRLILERELVKLLRILKQNLGSKAFFGRLIKGDYIECVLDNPKLALRVALIIKSFVKSLNIQVNKKTNKKIQDFKEYGIRIAVGVGELSILNKKKGIIDGEAIYLSGRAINEMTSSDKKIRDTLVFRSGRENWNDAFTPLFSLLDVLFAESTRAQSEIVFYKLLDKSEKEISEILKKSQSTINQHSTAVGWYAVDRAVKYFENQIN